MINTTNQLFKTMFNADFLKQGFFCTNWVLLIEVIFSERQ